MKLVSVRCPMCSSEVPWSAASTWRPFCSARCQGMDLGQWASDRYAIAGERADDVSGGETPAGRERVQ